MEDRTWRLRPPRGAPLHPAVAIARRVGIAVLIVLVNWVVVLAERDGYRDASDGSLSAVDALYYTTVTLSTTGYGDITPVSPSARLTNALFVTPLRFLFVLVLIGTTIQVLTERSREHFRVTRWRSTVHDHVVVCGYGAQGRSAVRSLRERDQPPEGIVVIDTDQRRVEEATVDGMHAVLGSATDEGVLAEAVVPRARGVIVAVDRDDTAVLATLTVRHLAPRVPVVASVREEQNADLARQSGADVVITSASAAGRLLGLATDSPRAVGVIEDLLASGTGLDMRERPATPGEVGRSPRGLGLPVVAVVRDGATLHYDDERADPLRAGDRLLYVARVGSAEPVLDAPEGRQPL